MRNKARYYKRVLNSPLQHITLLLCNGVQGEIEFWKCARTVYVKTGDEQSRGKISKTMKKIYAKEEKKNPNQATKNKAEEKIKRRRKKTVTIK